MRVENVPALAPHVVRLQMLSYTTVETIVSVACIGPEYRTHLKIYLGMEETEFDTLLTGLKKLCSEEFVAKCEEQPTQFAMGVLMPNEHCGTEI